MNGEDGKRINIYLYKIDKERIIAEEKSLIECLPEGRKVKLDKLTNPSVRATSIAAGLLQQYALKCERGLTIDEYDIAEEENGKPYIILKTGEIQYISISHSMNYAAAAVADSPIGIDVEEKSDKDFRVTKRVFSEPEKERVFSSDCPDDEFRKIWTEKEAYLKCTGEGITVPLQSFFKDMKTGEILRCRDITDRKRGASIEEYLSTGFYISNSDTDKEGFSISICKDEKLALDIISVSDL